MLGLKTKPTSPTPAAATSQPQPLARTRRSKKMWQKRMPTLVGLGILIVAMVAGVLLFGNGTGVFAPRATPQTTPKNIKISNVTDTSFTVSFITDESTPAFLKYGTSSPDLKNQAGDERDQITGTIKSYNTHHITVRGLQASTPYFFTLGTGSNSTFTNNGEPFKVKTAAAAGTQPAAKTVYGSVTTESGAPAEGAIVYVKHAQAGELSSLVKSSGSWAVYLSNARTPDGSNYATTTDEDTLLVSVQGPATTKKAQITTTVAHAQPVETIAYGQTTAQTTNMDDSVGLATTAKTPKIPTATESATQTTEKTTMENPQEVSSNDTNKTANLMTETDVSSESAILAEQMIMKDMTMDDAVEDTTEDTLAAEVADAPTNKEHENGEGAKPVATVVDIEAAKAATPTVTTTQPKIVGKAAPNVVIALEVHSKTQINREVTADENGNFELDIATLSENLEPGEHTVRYSYTDPTTSEEVSEVVTFYVAESASAETPYGSGNPYPMPTPTPSPTPSPSPSPSPSPTMEATPSAEATPEARVALPATDEAIPVSGSVGTTFTLVLGGLFFIIAGAWSFWISTQLKHGKLEI